MDSAYEDSIMRSLRRINRAIYLYSRQLVRNFDLTSPQVVCLRQILIETSISPGQLAKEVSLSQATVTGIVDRLETRGLVNRERSVSDRRRVILTLTAAGRDLCKTLPSPLQERFAQRLANLPPENQAVIDTVLSQIVRMMEAEDLDAAPVLETGPIPDGGEPP